MPTVRYRGGYSFVHNEHGELEEGDVVEVGEYTFEQFGRMFVRIDEETDHTADTPTETTDADSDAAEESVSEWDESEWLDGDYQDRADLVRTGAVDPHLDAIAEAETSQTVIDAVAARRDELEE